MTFSFTGTYPALITPFTEENLVDFDAFTFLVRNQLQNHAGGLVICGTTAEAASLTLEERSQLITHTCDTVQKKIPVIVGTSSNNTEKAIHLAQNAKKHGADALLITAPYYVLPPQEGIIAHFTAIHNAVDLPIFIYNNPGRTVVDISDETINQLSFLPRIIGIKDSSNDICRINSLQKILQNPLCLLSGDDASFMEYIAKGGQGCISVLSNLFPEVCHLLFRLSHAPLGELHKEQALYAAFMELYHAIFVDPNPMGVKYASSLLYGHRPHLRLPLVLPPVASQERIKKAVEAMVYVSKKNKENI